MKDLTGQRFGKLVVVKYDDSSTTRHPKWICQCDCGNIKSIHASALTGGLTNSCGCLRRETMDSKTRLHHIWKQMRHRALKHTSKSEYHFDRGITMCDEWANDFKTFKECSIAISSSEYHTLDERDALEEWLKFLKDRCLSQSKQEWSEEDEQYLLVCKNALSKYQVSDKWDAGIISRWLENKLKPLRP